MANELNQQIIITNCSKNFKTHLDWLSVIRSRVTLTSGEWLQQYRIIVFLYHTNYGNTQIVSGGVSQKEAVTSHVAHQPST